MLNRHDDQMACLIQISINVPADLPCFCRNGVGKFQQGGIGEVLDFHSFALRSKKA